MIREAVTNPYTNITEIVEDDIISLMKIGPNENACAEFNYNIFRENLKKFDPKYQYIGTLQLAYFWFCIIPVVNLIILILCTQIERWMTPQAQTLSNKPQLRKNSSRISTISKKVADKITHAGVKIHSIWVANVSLQKEKN